MTKKPEAAQGAGRASWTVEEARRELEGLLEAANKAPQEILFGQRRYRIVVVQKDDTPDGRELLRRGGPLDEDDMRD